MGEENRDKFDDHFFTRLKDVRAEIENNVFPILGDIMKKVREDDQQWVKDYIGGRLGELKERTGDEINVDKLAEIFIKLEDRVKLLEMERSEREEKEKANKSEGEIT